MNALSIFGAAIGPASVWAIKLWWPKTWFTIPTNAYPYIAAVFGGIGAYFLGKVTLPPEVIQAMLIGLSGVGVREALDQASKAVAAKIAARDNPPS